MTDAKLRKGVEEEVRRWSAKSFAELRHELQAPVCYWSESRDFKYEVEVQLIEDTSDYLHVVVSVDDGSLRKSVRPVSSSFLVFQDGRVDLPAEQQEE